MINGIDSKKVYITGASGRLGRALMKKLPDAIPIVRRPYGLPNEIMSDFGVADLKEILANAKAIIHLAGSMDFSNKSGLWDGNVGLTKIITEAAPPNCRIIFASSISVYGKKLAIIPADESTQCLPDSEYSKSKFMAEQEVSKHPEHVILRIGTVYGPEYQDYMMVLKKIQEGKMLIIGDGKNNIPFVHVDDVASAIINSIEKGKGIYVIAGDPLTQKEIFDIAAKELGVAPPEKKMNFSIAYWYAYLRNKLGKKGFTTEHISILGSNRVFNCKKAKEELGFKPRPLSDGIKQMAGYLKGL